MYTIEELRKARINKEEMFKGSGFTFDYALPQDWLNEFSNDCKKYCPEITYDIILSTTVWAYTEKNFYGFPVFGCIEVWEKYYYFTRNK